MGKIPEYHAAELAKQAVGTPGVDASAGDALTKVGTTLQGESDGIMKIGQANFEEQQYQNDQAQALVQKAQEHLQHIADTTESTKQAYALNSQLMQKKLDIQQANLDTPGVATQQIRDQGQLLINSFTDNLVKSGATPDVVANVTNQATNTLLGHVNDTEQWTVTQNAAKAQADIVNSQISLSQQAGLAGQSGTFKDFQDVLEKSKELERNATFVFGADKAKEIGDKTRLQMTKEYLDGQMLTNPAAMEATLKSGALKSILPESDALAYHNKYTGYLKAIQDNAIRQDRVNKLTDTTAGRIQIQSVYSSDAPLPQKLVQLGNIKDKGIANGNPQVAGDAIAATEKLTAKQKALDKEVQASNDRTKRAQKEAEAEKYKQNKIDVNTFNKGVSQTFIEFGKKGFRDVVDTGKLTTDKTYYSKNSSTGKAEKITNVEEFAKRVGTMQSDLQQLSGKTDQYGKPLIAPQNAANIQSFIDGANKAIQAKRNPGFFDNVGKHMQDILNWGQHAAPPGPHRDKLHSSAIMNYMQLNGRYMDQNNGDLPNESVAELMRNDSQIHALNTLGSDDA